VADGSARRAGLRVLAVATALLAALGAVVPGGALSVPVTTVNGVRVTADQTNPDHDAATATATVIISGERCDNCLDDDGNGLVDIEDPACCTNPSPLDVTRARLRQPEGSAPLGSLLVRGRLVGDGWNQVDPRRDGATVIVTNGATTLVCCQIEAAKWMKLTRKSFGFWDQLVRYCPPLKDAELARRRNGNATFALRGSQPVSLRSAALTTAVQSGDRCAVGGVVLRPARSGALVYP
jgi:hypothetical protein